MLASLSNRSRGGARVATAGAKHTMIGVGLSASERCPPTGDGGERCGGTVLNADGSSTRRGECVRGMCEC